MTHETTAPDPDRLSIEDFPDQYWLEDGRCDECGEPISRHWTEGENSAWFDNDGLEHDDSCCPNMEDEDQDEEGED